MCMHAILGSRELSPLLRTPARRSSLHSRMQSYCKVTQVLRLGLVTFVLGVVHPSLAFADDPDLPPKINKNGKIS